LGSVYSIVFVRDASTLGNLDRGKKKKKEKKKEGAERRKKGKRQKQTSGARGPLLFVFFLPRCKSGQVLAER
jgi:hypothetical protein